MSNHLKEILNKSNDFRKNKFQIINHHDQTLNDEKSQSKF